MFDQNDPQDPEAVRRHREARREKRLCRRLHDAPALAQRREQSIDLAVISEGKRERKALKARAFGAMSVGEQKRRIANLQPIASSARPSKKR